MLKRFAFFQLHNLIGSEIRNYYNEFLKLENATPSQLQQLQEYRLKRILHHAAKNVPFYVERVAGRYSSKTRTQYELADFPILTKEDIRRNFLQLMTNQLREEYQSTSRKVKGYSWVQVKTGGSTGVPTTVIHDKEYRDRGRAGRLYSQYLCGFPLGTPYFRLWGSMKEINQMTDSLSHRLVGYLSGEILLNAFQMNDEQIDKYIDIVNASQVDHMMAYVDAAHQMASYSLKKGREIKQFKSIMACAGTVTDDARQLVNQAFKTRLHNKYGSRDCADMACECEAGGIHIYANNLSIEVVDCDGHPLPPGKVGRIVVTLLFNDSFPLIRYDIGDMGVLSDGKCECGRPYPLLGQIEGRSVEFLLSNESGYVSPAYIIHLVGVVHNPGFIKRFQLVQTSLTDYHLKLETESDISTESYNDTLCKITRDLKVVFGPSSKIGIERVDFIPTAESGKFLYTINRVKA